MRPDATSSTSASATCTTTSRLRARCRSRLWLDVRVAPRRAVTSRGPLYFKTGMNPNSNPDRSEAVKRERENDRIDRDLAQSGQRLRTNRQQELERSVCDTETECATNQAKQQTLLQQFTRNAPPSRAERRSRRELLLTCPPLARAADWRRSRRQSATQRRSFP